MPPPSPPRVKDGLIIAGKPTKSNAEIAWSIFFAIWALADSKPILFILSLNNSRSSALFIESGFAPMISISYFSKTLELYRSKVALRAVWPPIVGRIAVGLSISMIFSIVFFSIGSIYVESAIIGSVIMVAGLEFISITLIPSSLSALQACAPE